MKILVIGEPCIDVIHKVDGKVYHEHGGISYSIVASTLVNDGAETLPIIGLGKEDSTYFRRLFGKLDGLNFSGIYETAAPVRKVDLFYEDENSRWECSTRPVEPTPFERIRPFLPADGIHLNLIGGNDVEIDTLRKIRAAAPDCHIHLDLHNIVMKRMPDGKRVRGPVKDYLEWSEMADTVQMNEEEANTIDAKTSDKRELAEKILSRGAAAFIISLADRGLLLYEKVGGRISELILPAVKAHIVDPTGSGDVLGAAFLHSLLKGRNFEEAARDGINMASRKVGVAGPSGLLIKNSRERVASAASRKSAKTNVH